MPHFRVDVLRRLRGWDPWNVTEDADLGVRLARAGYRVETLDSTTHEEAPARVRAWLGQRRRWIKGWMQTIAAHGRDPARLTRELGPWRAIALLALLGNGVVTPLLGPAFAAGLVIDALWGNLLAPGSLLAAVAHGAWITVAACGAASTLATAGVGVARRGLRREALWLLAWPVYQALLCVAAWGAALELRRAPYHWTKTSHGHARTSRLAQAKGPAAPISPAR